MLSPIKVLVRDVPQLVRDVLAHAIVSEPDMELVPERWSPPPPAESTGPDVVIMTASGEAGRENVTRTLWHWPRAQVLLISPDGHECVLYEQRIRRTRLGELSPRELVDAIRAAVRRDES